MSWTIRIIALASFSLTLARPLGAEPTPGPPAWQDGSSVYLRMSHQDSAASEAKPEQLAAVEVALNTSAAPSEAPPKVDPAVVPAAHQAPTAPQSDRRQMAPPSGNRSIGFRRNESNKDNLAASVSQRLANFGVPVESIYTVLSALAVVIGAFLVFAWLLRRGGRTANRRGMLPGDVVSVLGRVPLAARQFAELLRVGNKLVLVSITPTGAEPLTEVTDPVEVDRLLGLCQQNNPHSTTKAFEQVFRQLSGETAPHGFLGSESLPTSLSSPAGAYRAYRGDTRG